MPSTTAAEAMVIPAIAPALSVFGLPPVAASEVENAVVEATAVDETIEAVMVLTVAAVVDAMRAVVVATVEDTVAVVEAVVVMKDETVPFDE